MISSILLCSKDTLFACTFTRSKLYIYNICNLGNLWSLWYRDLITMVAIANIMKKQQQQMNKITDILARISGFLEQGKLGQNTPSNGVPPSTSHQQPLG